jgi:putative transposase
MIFIGQASLPRAVSEFMAHYDAEHNHQGLENRLIRACPCVAMNNGRVYRRPRLSGMLNFYYREAA